MDRVRPKFVARDIVLETIPNYYKSYFLAPNDKKSPLLALNKILYKQFKRRLYLIDRLFCGPF